MDPVSMSALILGIITALGVAVLAVCKVIRRSSCCFGMVDIETNNKKNSNLQSRGKSKESKESNEDTESS